MSTFIRCITSQYIIIIIVCVVIFFKVIVVVVVVVVVDAVKNIIRRPIIVHLNDFNFEGIIIRVAVIDIIFVWVIITIIMYRTYDIALTFTFNYLSLSPFQAWENNYQLDNIANFITDRCMTQ